LRYALANGEEFGIFGGTTPRERRYMRKVVGAA
jgi:Transcription factor WhiB